jgi:hypothetical protein
MPSRRRSVGYIRKAGFSGRIGVTGANLDLEKPTTAAQESFVISRHGLSSE